ncbi:MAG: TonB-dependent receptor [Gemmatimonadetes bacterium]|nr:TonB-dependent receptor [Gemmatimonadota bacterium]
MRRLVLVLVLLGMSTWPVSGQVVRGRLLASADHLPISAGRVELLDDRGQVVSGTLADSSGAFMVAAELAGRYRLRGTATGYVTATTPAVILDANDHIVVRFVLSPAVVLLAPLEITARSRPLISGMTLAGYHERRDKGLGFAITQERIKRQNPRMVSDLLRQVPGVRVEWAFGGSAISIPATGNARFGPCPVKVLVDGMEFRWGSTTVDDVPVHDVWAIEVFRNLSELPVEMAGSDARCGVVAIWTHRGLSS